MQLSKYILLTIPLYLICFSSYAQKDTRQDLTSYVDPFIGSGGHGHVFVGASVPFGAVQLGPQNIFKGWDWCSGYHYSDSVLIGFTHTHLSGTGATDLGDLLIMPYTGPVKIDQGTQQNPGSGFASRYSHPNETAQPGYYSVKLDDYNIDAELTATERVGFHQYHFPEGKEAHVIIDLLPGNGDQATETYIEQSDEYTIKGYRFSKGWANDQRFYFAIVSSAPLNHFEVYKNDSLTAGKSAKGINIKGLINFKEAPKLLQLKVGISPVSSANALANIKAEIPAWDFDKVKDRAQQKWEKELAKIDITTADEAAKKVFYTALYHTMIDPCLYNDHNGDYRGTDKKVYKNADFDNYTIFSLWDTYRALAPLYTLTQPGRENDIIHSMLAIYQQQGKLPIWHLEGCESNLMPGMSGVQVVVEAYLKGFHGFDTALAYEAVKNSAMRDELGLKYARNLDYIPCDKIDESVAKAMEYSISSGSIALMAKAMHRKDDFEYFTKRSHNYRLYFDPQTHFFRGKKSDGSWDPVFDPLRSSHPWINDYSEGNAWQYTWLVPQDVEGLAKLLGGDEAFTAKLDSLFSLPPVTDPNAPPDISGMIGQYAHGNEPGHHTTYLYAYVGQQWKTAEKVHYILTHMYSDSTDGISGNEDCGQMSAWYIFSALGFYPVFPASSGYVLGSPLFDKATIHLGNGKDFTVEAINNSPENMYIQRIERNGKPYPQAYILHKDILEGGTFTFFMGNKPNKNFGNQLNDRPRSEYVKS